MTTAQLPSRPVPDNEDRVDVYRSLYETYGPLMDAKALCRVFYYPSLDALQEARRRGKVPFKVVSIKGRPGVYANTADIADLLNKAFGEAAPGNAE